LNHQSEMILHFYSLSKRIKHEVFNVGDTQENYTKKMIADILLKYVPNAEIEYIQKSENSRDYCVSFARIKEKLGFSISKNVEKGIQEILFLIKNKVITNSDNPLCKNIKCILIMNMLLLLCCMIYDNYQPFINYQMPSIWT
jgi:dTDP-D-glucose 4,6-dehydratase